MPLTCFTPPRAPLCARLNCRQAYAQDNPRCLSCAVLQGPRVLPRPVVLAPLGRSPR